MWIKYNIHFERNIKSSLTDVGGVVPGNISRLLSIGFKAVDECVFYDIESNVNAGRSDTFGDATGSECFYNNIHISDYANVPAAQFFKYGLYYSLALSEKLRDLGGGFCVILSYEIDPEFPDCCVTFHRVRPGETYLSDDIEGLESHAVAQFFV